MDLIGKNKFKMYFTTDTNEHWRYLILHLLHAPSFKSINFSMQVSWTCDKSVVTDIVVKSIRMFQKWYCDRYLYLFLILSVQTRMYRWNHYFFFKIEGRSLIYFPQMTWNQSTEWRWSLIRWVFRGWTGWSFIETATVRWMQYELYQLRIMR